jgi:hypothetical protein
LLRLPIRLERKKLMFPHYNYDARNFTDVAPVWGDRLWIFLNEPATVATMTSASDRGLTAAESVGAALLEGFGEEMKQHRVKRFIGLLIRQVMEHNGYRHVSYNQSTPNNPLFVTASLYTRRS